jgi:hypothetical protein
MFETINMHSIIANRILVVNSPNLVYHSMFSKMSVGNVFMSVLHVPH